MKKFGERTARVALSWTDALSARMVPTSRLLPPRCIRNEEIIIPCSTIWGFVENTPLPKPHHLLLPPLFVGVHLNLFSQIPKWLPNAIFYFPGVLFHKEPLLTEENNTFVCHSYKQTNNISEWVYFLTNNNDLHHLICYHFIYMYIYCVYIYIYILLTHLQLNVLFVSLVAVHGTDS